MTSGRDNVLSCQLGNYRNWLYHEAIRLTDSSNPDLDDLVQEGYVAMWKATGTYNPSRGALPAWLTFKARRRMLEVLARGSWTGQPSRRSGRNAAVMPETVSLDAPRSEDGATLGNLLSAPDMLESAMLAYHRGEILAALNRLSPQQRRYVAARFWQGMTSGEMASEIFGYDPSALWNSKRNGARQKLANDLDHLEEAMHLAKAYS